MTPPIEKSQMHLQNISASLIRTLSHKKWWTITYLSLINLGEGQPTHLVDMYCGASLFTITLPSLFKKVAGIELSQSVFQVEMKLLADGAAGGGFGGDEENDYGYENHVDDDVKTEKKSWISQMTP